MESWLTGCWAQTKSREGRESAMSTALCFSSQVVELGLIPIRSPDSPPLEDLRGLNMYQPYGYSFCLGSFWDSLWGGRGKGNIQFGLEWGLRVAPLPTMEFAQPAAPNRVSHGLPGPLIGESDVLVEMLSCLMIWFSLCNVRKAICCTSFNNWIEIFFLFAFLMC